MLSKDVTTNMWLLIGISNVFKYFSIAMGSSFLKVKTFLISLLHGAISSLVVSVVYIIVIFFRFGLPVIQMFYMVVIIKNAPLYHDARYWANCNDRFEMLTTVHSVKIQ